MRHELISRLYCEKKYLGKLEMCPYFCVLYVWNALLLYADVSGLHSYNKYCFCLSIMDSLLLTFGEVFKVTVAWNDEY